MHRQTTGIPSLAPTAASSHSTVPATRGVALLHLELEVVIEIEGLQGVELILEIAVVEE